MKYIRINDSIYNSCLLAIYITCGNSRISDSSRLPFCLFAFQNWEAVIATMDYICVPDHVSSSSRVQRTASAGRTFVQDRRYTDSFQWQTTYQLIPITWINHGHIKDHGHQIALCSYRLQQKDSLFYRSGGTQGCNRLQDVNGWRQGVKRPWKKTTNAA